MFCPAAEPDERERALETIAELARRHGFSPAEIEAVLRDQGHSGTSPGRRTVLVRVLSYLGGTFVFAGIGVFIASHWDAMNGAARVTVTGGSGVAAFVLAWIARGDLRYEKAATSFFLIAAALEPTGILVAFDEYASGGNWHAACLVAAGACALQFVIAFAALRRTALLFVSILFCVWFWQTALDWMHVDAKVIGLVVGGALLLLTVGIDRTRHRAIAPFWYLVASAGFLASLFDLVEATPVEACFLAVACAFVYSSVVVRSRMLLFTGTVALLSYTAYFTDKHFAESIGWPVALVVFGMLLIGLSAAALRIDRRYLRS